MLQPRVMPAQIQGSPWTFVGGAYRMGQAARLLSRLRLLSTDPLQSRLLLRGVTTGPSTWDRSNTSCITVRGTGLERQKKQRCDT
ncbi:Protein of unknown function [Pyronema omphalodes CBS 100304]|uniref:Uncharacterized protein n=1 Tax=Pyronema omphalodes (strain CBS 100304) TaxID=1076935 RepID=U4KV87_PYROM|nr:Protein of unknown function [Pyronema omphalodes CBS 100304]